MNFAEFFQFNPGKHKGCFFAVVLSLIVCASGYSQADKDSKNQRQETNQRQNKNQKNSKSVDKPGEAKQQKEDDANTVFDRKTEHLLLGFVRKNHPELTRLLQSLRRHHPAKYQQALKDIDRSRVMILAFKDRDPARYQMQLDAWKLKTRAQLVTAKMAIDDSPKLNTELRKIVQKQQGLRIEIAKADLKRFQDRVVAARQKLKQLEDHKEETIERSVKHAMRKAELVRKQQRIAEQLRDSEGADSKSNKEKRQQAGASGKKADEKNSKGDNSKDSDKLPE